MPYLSAVQLLNTVNNGRSKWNHEMALPIEYGRTGLAIEATENIPAIVKRVVGLAHDSRAPDYHVQTVLGITLKTYGASVQTQLRRSIAGVLITLEVGMVGYIKSVPRVVFFDSYYVYGNLRSASPEDMRWYSERGSTDLQLNELLAMLLAAQYGFDYASVNPHKILVIFPNLKNDRLFWTTFTPTKAMLVNSENLNAPMEKFHIEQINSVKLTTGAPEVYTLVHTFLGEPDQ